MDTEPVLTLEPLSTIMPGKSVPASSPETGSRQRQGVARDRESPEKRSRQRRVGARESPYFLTQKGDAVSALGNIMLHLLLTLRIYWCYIFTGICWYYIFTNTTTLVDTTSLLVLHIY
jgi:hypothetical protein